MARKRGVGRRGRSPFQEQVAFAVAEHSVRFNEKYRILRCETDPVIDTKLAVIAKMNFPMDDFPVLTEYV